jgi:hypothetical protein
MARPQPSVDDLRQTYAAHVPLRPTWPPFETMLADPLLRRVLIVLALHCPRPTAEAIKRGALIADPPQPNPPRPAAPRRVPIRPFLDQRRKSAGEREDD